MGVAGEKDRERTAGEDVFMEKMVVHRTQPAAKRHASRPTVAEANRENPCQRKVFLPILLTLRRGGLTS